MLKNNRPFIEACWSLSTIIVFLCLVVAIAAASNRLRNYPAPQVSIERPVTFCTAAFARLPPELNDADCSYPNVRDI